MYNDYKWRHIILADDDADDCIFFTEALTLIYPGLKLTTEANGANLLSRLYMPPEPVADIVFLDLNMPLKTGFECLEEIRGSAVLKETVVIILTTCCHHADIEKLYAAGANFFITKPADFTLLCRLLEKSFEAVAAHGRLQPGKSEFVLLA